MRPMRVPRRPRAHRSRVRVARAGRPVSDPHSRIPPCSPRPRPHRLRTSNGRGPRPVVNGLGHRRPSDRGARIRPSSRPRRPSHAHHSHDRHRAPRALLRPRRLGRRRHRGGQAAGAVRARRGAGVHRRERRPDEGHREHRRPVHEREAGRRRPLQLRRRRAAGTARQHGRLRGEVPRHRRAGRARELRLCRDHGRSGRRRRLPRHLWVPGRQDAVDTPFQVVIV